MSENAKRELSPTGLFASFMFLQFTILAMANRAGDGFLSTELRERVYYVVQVFVILGFLAYAAAERALRRARVRRAAAAVLLPVLLVGAAVMVFADAGSLFYLIVTFAVMPCLGFLGGAVYHCFSGETAAGGKTARSMGLGSAAAAALQFVLQLQWGVTPILPAAMLAAFVLPAVWLLRAPTPPERTAAPPEPLRPRRLVFACLIAAALVLFNSFYNGYIHHMQVLSGYTDYNVYTWPRLMLVPCYLLFAFLGDRKQGKLVPVAALCIALVAMLNSVLAGSRGAYWLNMCLFYCGIAASVSYYNLTFWRLAGRTRHPALWASMGRMLDSAMVLSAGALHLFTLPPAAVLTANIAELAAVILLMAIGGDFDLTLPAAPERVPSVLSEEATFDRMRQRFSLTSRETEVLRELVLTEDKQAVVSERLSITVKALQKYVTQLYRKTGATTRSGLTELYHDTMLGH